MYNVNFFEAVIFDDRSGGKSRKMFLIMAHFSKMLKLEYFALPAMAICIIIV